GTAYEQGKLLEEHLNKTRGSARLSIRVQFIPLSRDELLPALLEGKGDIVMGNLTITPERKAIVDFTDPWIGDVEEIVVARPGGPDVTTVDDLSGKDVFVRKSSSYYESLVKLNEKLASEGKPPVRLTPAPGELEDEDLLEMANAGLIDLLVVDNPQGVVLAARLAGAEAVSEGDSAKRRRDRVGRPEGESATERRAELVPRHQRARLAAGAHDLAAIPVEHAVRERSRSRCRAQALHGVGGAVPQVRRPVPHGLDADGRPGL